MPKTVEIYFSVSFKHLIFKPCNLAVSKLVSQVYLRHFTTGVVILFIRETVKIATYLEPMVISSIPLLWVEVLACVSQS